LSLLLRSLTLCSPERQFKRQGITEENLLVEYLVEPVPAISSVSSPPLVVSEPTECRGFPVDLGQPSCAPTLKEYILEVYCIDYVFHE
jgi:hypothetical protein